MPTPTYDLISSTTLGTAVSNVTIGSIPGTYRDLVCVIVPTSAATPDFYVRVNGSSASSIYNRIAIYGNGSTVSHQQAATETQFPMNVLAYPSSVADTNLILHIFDYAQTNKHKNILVRANKASSGVDGQVCRVATTSAITSLYFFVTSTTLSVGTTFNLYGIAG